MSRTDLERLCDRENVRITAEYGGVELPEDWSPGTHPYKVTLRFQRRQLTVPFFMGSAHECEPTAGDVLSCLISDARIGEESFEDFCSELGYDPDSRRAERTWRTCRDLTPRVSRFLGDRLEAFSEAEH